MASCTITTTTMTTNFVCKNAACMISMQRTHIKERTVDGLWQIVCSLYHLVAIKHLAYVYMYSRPCKCYLHRLYIQSPACQLYEFITYDRALHMWPL